MRERRACSERIRDWRQLSTPDMTKVQNGQTTEAYCECDSFEARSQPVVSRHTSSLDRATLHDCRVANFTTVRAALAARQRGLEFGCSKPTCRLGSAALMKETELFV